MNSKIIFHFMFLEFVYVTGVFVCVCVLRAIAKLSQSQILLLPSLCVLTGKAN